MHDEPLSNWKQTLSGGGLDAQIARESFGQAFSCECGNIHWLELDDSRRLARCPHCDDWHSVPVFHHLDRPRVDTYAHSGWSSKRYRVTTYPETRNLLFPNCVRDPNYAD